MQRTQNYNLCQWEADDRIHHDDFNDAMSAIDAALGEKCGIVFGSYRGNGVYPRAIDLGFQPKAVFLTMHDGTTHVSAATFGGMFSRQYPLGAGSSPYANMTESGFTLLRADTNRSNDVYYYLALK